eukprot:COSAG02_NODE_813_length_16901_cov_45.562135_8_plen_205_part_00
MLWPCTGHAQAEESTDAALAPMPAAETRIEQEKPAPVEQELDGIDAQDSKKLSEQEQEELNDDIELVCETLANIAGRLKTRAMLTQVQTFLDNLSPADDVNDDDTRDGDNASSENGSAPGAVAEVEGAGGENDDPDRNRLGSTSSTASVEYSEDDWPEGLRQLSAEDWQDEAKKAGMDLQEFKRIVMKEHKIRSSSGTHPSIAI